MLAWDGQRGGWRSCNTVGKWDLTLEPHHAIHATVGLLVILRWRGPRDPPSSLPPRLTAWQADFNDRLKKIRAVRWKGKGWNRRRHQTSKSSCRGGVKER